MLEMTLQLAQDPAPWFANPGAVGGLLGAGVGVLGGGIYGPLVGILAPRGKAKALVMGYHGLLLLLGLALLIGGLVALVGGQPYGVWFTLLLPGGILSLLMICLWPVIAMRYREAEQRRLEAAEFRRN
jgi:hypothetical protein